MRSRRPTAASDKSSSKPCVHVAIILLNLKTEQTRALKASKANAPDKMYVPEHRTLTSPGERLREAKLYCALECKTVAALRDVLQRNKQPSSGLKGELIDRVVDGTMRGALPKCPGCHRANVKYTLGQYRCKGVFRGDRVQVCDFVADEVQRTKWID